MYRCHVCRAVAPAKHSLLRHIVYRPNKQIARETPVCARCLERLQERPLSQLVRDVLAQPATPPVAPTARLAPPAVAEPIELGPTVTPLRLFV